eukprot:CAMPEP_0182479624 /NCGR_PEP_ID=MMETSP1319-20130603/34503_1 /TAXON_ID=172717 /ORGANISM="Bolidomonas pacifica, Strain RCC208" /LENGTH=47 /DNA_ID= /DNA_START= /DNA_END= /DNA_ORIENTATION=
MNFDTVFRKREENEEEEEMEDSTEDDIEVAESQTLAWYCAEAEEMQK